MNTQEKQDFTRLVNHFGAQKANELHTDFMCESKMLSVEAFKEGRAIDYVENIEPTLFKDFVNRKIEEDSK